MIRILSRIALAALVMVAFVASAAHAVNVPFTGALGFQLLSLPPVTVAGSGVAVVNGSGAGPHVNTLALAASVFETSDVVVPITDPAVAPIKGIQLTAVNGAGTITSGAGALPLGGSAKVCLFGPCPSAVANLIVPLSAVGVGGASFITGSVELTVIGAPWTTGTAAIGTITQMGYAHGPASNASSTGLPSGQMRLVTPIFVSTSIGSSLVVPAWGILTLHFVPEPATMALLGGGLVLLAAAGRARLRRH